jgi:RNA polymerase sigma-70 factor (ECF subfamily)
VPRPSWPCFSRTWKPVPRHRNKSRFGPFLLTEMTSPSPATNREETFSRWGGEHGPAVRGYLLAMVRRVDVAEDLMQEVFCRAWEAHYRYQEHGNAKAYLLRIADRLLIDRARRLGREVTLDPEEWRRVEPTGRTGDPAQAAARGEDARRLDEALRRLSPMQRRVLLLRYYGQLRFAEIAETIGCPLGTVLSHGHRGLAVLRKLLVESANE